MHRGRDLLAALGQLLGEALLDEIADVALAPRAQMRGAHRIGHRAAELTCGLEPIRRFAIERLREHVRDEIRNVGPISPDIRNRLLHHGAEREVVGLPLEQPAQRDHLVHHDAECEQIDAAIDRSTAQLLRRHVGVLAFDGAVLGLRRGRTLRLRDSEIEDLRDARIAQEDVRRRDVAVDQAEALAIAILELVCIVQRIAGLLDHCREKAEIEVRLRLRRAAQQRQHRDALEVFHHDVQNTAGLAELVDLADVAVRHLRSDLRLGDQHLAEPRVVGEVREDPLHDVELFEPCGTFESREENLAHTTGREPR